MCRLMNVRLVHSRRHNFCPENPPIVDQFGMLSGETSVEMG